MPSETALVSVVVRTCGRPTLPRALDSLRAQTHPALEVVLVDASGAGLPALEPGGLTLRRVEPGRELARAAAANAGLDAATGDYLAFLDDDDWLAADHVERLLAALLAAGAQAAYAGVEQVDASTGAVCGRFNEPFDRDRLLYENTIPIHAMLFARGLLAAGPRFDEALALYEDWDFWLQLTEHVTPVHLDALTATYAIDPRSPSHDAAARAGALRALLAKWLPRWTLEQHAGLLEALLARRRVEAALRTELAGAWTRVAELEAARVELQRALHEREGQLACQRVELAALRDSWSWRVTGPLRGALRRLRGEP